MALPTTYVAAPNIWSSEHFAVFLCMFLCHLCPYDNMLALQGRDMSKRYLNIFCPILTVIAGILAWILIKIYLLNESENDCILKKNICNQYI